MNNPSAMPFKKLRIVKPTPKVPQRPAGLPVRPIEPSASDAAASSASTVPHVVNPETTTLEGVLPPSTATTTLPDDAPMAASLYRALLRGLYDAILIVNPNGNIVDCNRRARIFFQYDYTELCAMQAMELVSGMSSKIIERIRDHLESGRFTLLDAFCQRRDDSRFPVEIAISQLTAPGRNDLVFSIRNVTRRRAMEAQLHTEHNALKNSASGIVITNADATIQYANPAFCALCGTTPETAVGRNITQFWRGENLQNDLVDNPLAGVDWNGEIEGRMENGRYLRVQATASANRDPSGKAIGLVYSFVDVTERHAAQQRIQREADAQIQAVSQQDAFAGRLTIISLTDIIQLINTTGKTGTLTVLDTEHKPIGEAVFASGELHAARQGSTQGESAFKQLLTQPSESFQFDPEIRSPRDPSITKPLMTLLMETAQSIDETQPERVTSS